MTQKRTALYVITTPWQKDLETSPEVKRSHLYIITLLDCVKQISCPAPCEEELVTHAWKRLPSKLALPGNTSAHMQQPLFAGLLSFPARLRCLFLYKREQLALNSHFSFHQNSIYAVRECQLVIDLTLWVLKLWLVFWQRCCLDLTTFGANTTAEGVNSRLEMWLYLKYRPGYVGIFGIPWH